MDRHIRITYTVASNDLAFDYRIKDSAVGQFEEKFQAWIPEARVTIDDFVTDELPAIPCAELWEP